MTVSFPLPQNSITCSPHCGPHPTPNLHTALSGLALGPCRASELTAPFKLPAELVSTNEALNALVIHRSEVPKTGASLVTQTVKTLPAMQETRASFLGQEDAQEEGVSTHFGILAWRIPWTEEPGRATVHGVTQELDTS